MLGVDEDDVIRRIKFNETQQYERCKLCFASNSEMSEINYCSQTKHGHVSAACAGENSKLRDIRGIRKQWDLCKKCRNRCEKKDKKNEINREKYKQKRQADKFSDTQNSPKKQKIETTSKSNDNKIFTDDLVDICFN